MQSNAIKNCLVIAKDIQIAEDICGPALASLKGKPTRKKPLVVKHDCMAVSKLTQGKHMDNMLSGDVFFIQGLSFLIVLSHNILFTMTEFLENCKMLMMLIALDHTFKSCDSK